MLIFSSTEKELFTVSMLLVIGGGAPQAGFDPMAWLALILIVLFVLFLMSCVNVKGYTCKECDYWTPDRQDAAGHQHLHSLHKFDL